MLAGCTPLGDPPTVPLGLSTTATRAGGRILRGGLFYEDQQDQGDRARTRARPGVPRGTVRGLRGNSHAHPITFGGIVHHRIDGRDANVERHRSHDSIRVALGEREHER